jgi:hypothetical protein
LRGILFVRRHDIGVVPRATSRLNKKPLTYSEALGNAAFAALAALPDLEEFPK